MRAESMVDAIKQFSLPGNTYLLIEILFGLMSVTRYSVLVWCKTSFTFLCSKDFLRITDGANKIFGVYCGNKSGQNLLVTGDKVQIIFHSDDKIERRGYLLNFTLVSPASVSPDSVPSGKWDHKEAGKTQGIHQFYLPLIINNS